MIAIFPEIIALARGAEIERLSVAARKYFETGRTTPRPDLVRLLKAAGLSVATVKSPAAPIGALVARDKKGAFEIGAVLSPTVDELTARFVLAHLFGHYLLDILPLIAAGDYAAGGFREEICPLKRYALTAPSATGMDPAERKERRADQFASALLLPAGMVKKALEKIGDVVKVAEFFAVTRPCLLRRLEDLGLGRAVSGPESFLAAERQLGGAARKAEADADTIAAAAVKAPAEPAAMPRSYAASTYGSTERNTRKVPPVRANQTPAPRPVKAGETRMAAPPPDTSGEAPSKAAAPVPTMPLASAKAAANATEGDGVKGQGLERLRAIARSLDKSVPK